MEYDAAAALRKHFEPPREEKPPIDPSLPYLQQLNKGLEPLENKIRSGIAGLSRSVVPGNQYPLAKLDELASQFVGALTAPNNPMGRGDAPPPLAWPPKSPEDIYTYNREIRKKDPEAAKAGGVVGDI